MIGSTGLHQSLGKYGSISMDRQHHLNSGHIQFCVRQISKKELDSILNTTGRENLRTSETLKLASTLKLTNKGISDSP